MAVEQHPRARATDGGRIALAALFLYIIAAAMLLSLNSGDGGEVAEDAPREAFDESADADSSVAAGGVTHFVATADEWQQAVAAAKPGDEIRLTATIRQPLIYEGGDDGEPADGASGTPEAPIVITADEGVWIDPGAFETRGWAGLNIRYVSHVHAVGLQIRNAQFGIRCLQCTGSASSPIRLADNTIESLGFVGIHVAGHLDTHAPSSHVVIEGNSISDTGNLVERFGEGIYLGYGGLEWVDETSNIVVRNNEIAHTSAEGIDIKPGTREIVVEGNRLHHVAPIDGGAISAHYVNGGLNPKLDELDRVLIRDNRIWNHNLDGAPGASDAAVWIGHGGVELIDNKFWGFRIHPNTRSVRIKAKADFGPHPITIVDNTFWTERGWVAEGDYDPKAIVASGNIGPEATGIELPVTIDAFIGPVPPIGEGGDADNGGGPGSGLELARGSSATAPSPPPAQPQAPEPPPSTQPPAPELPATAAPDAAPPAAAPPAQLPATAAPAAAPPAELPATAAPDAAPPAAAPPAQLPATAAPEAAPPAAKPQPNKPPTAKPEPNKPPPASKRPSRASDAAAAAALSGTAGTEPPAAGVAATPADTPVAASGPAQANNPTNDAGGGPAAATTPVAQTTAVATTPASRAVDTLPAVPAPDSAGASDPQQAAGGTAVAAASQSETPNQTNDLVFDNGPGWDPSPIQPSRRAIDTEPGLAISGDEETAQLPTPTATTTTNSTDEEAWSGRAERSAATLVIILATATLVVPSLQRRILRGR